jgi:NADPH:quinone reductase-like Zn-dependent oxidoreductase
MRALHVPAAGQQPQLSEVPTPTVTDGTVLIRVTAAGLNPIDNGIAAGMLAAMMPHNYPVILGRDAAGIVEEVGMGVDHVQVGDEVFGHVLLAPPIEAGTLAEYALLPAAAVALKPADLDFVTAAALPLAGAAASATVDAIDAQPGETVLVNGASGGVGSYVVQLLAARGVNVVATGTSQDTERLRSLGASIVVDYTVARVVDQIRATYRDGVDALVNLAGYTAADVPLDAVRTGGRVSTTTGVPDDETLTGRGLTGTSIMAGPVREVIASMAEQVASGSLKVDVGDVLPLEQAAEGLTTIAKGNAHGKIIVTIGS